MGRESTARNEVLDGGEPERLRRQRLGQFFTPPQVARFAWDALRLLAPRQRRAPLVVDPAAGEGVFFAVSREVGFPRGARLVGSDIDSDLAPRWRERFDDDPSTHLSVADGLIDDDRVGLRQGTADFVVGNPPFGGDGLRDLLALLANPAHGSTSWASEQLSLFGQTPVRVRPRVTDGAEPLAPDARASLLMRARGIAGGHGCWRHDFGRMEKQPSLLGQAATSQAPPEILPPDVIRRLAATPIEVLFSERFVRLCRPGGWLAVVLPAGVLAAAQTRPLRDWMWTQGRPVAIVTLPLHTFSGVGANVEASLLLFRKFRGGEPVREHKRIAMAAPREGVPLDEYLDEVLAKLRRDREIVAGGSERR